MDFIPYSRQEIDEADVEAVRKVLTSDFLTQGPAVPLFEESFAIQHKAKHAVSCVNATAALHLACLALELGDGDILWTSPNSFVASANCGLYCGAEVDFVDIDPLTRNMSLNHLKQKLADGRRDGKLPKVVVPVDFAGLPCDLGPMRQLADEYGFRILADCSHAVGAEYMGEPVGSRFADISVFSFHPVKIITTGEGGLCLTNDDQLVAKLRLLRSHGITRSPDEMLSESDGPWYYEQIGLGFNYRLTDIQAALGASQLRQLCEKHSARSRMVERYNELLQPLPLKTVPKFDDRTSAHHLYVVEVSTASVSRYDAFMALREAKISVNVHYIPIHLQPYYRKLGFKPGDFPNSEEYYRNAITLPLFPSLTTCQQDYVVEQLTHIFS